MLRAMKLDAAFAVLLLLAACGDNGSTSVATTGGDASTGGETGSSTNTPTTGGTTVGDATTGSATTSEPPDPTDAPEPTTGASDPTTGGSTGPDATTGDDATSGDDTTSGDDLLDPNLDGPWTIDDYTGSFEVDGVDVPTRVFHPTRGGELYPVVLIAHGFQLPAAQYTTYAQRLATHGYVAVLVDFQAGFFNPDHVAYTQQLLGGIDWVAGEAALAGIADVNNVGLTGHSLGGKLSILGTIMDNRVRASITLDPVDSATMCDPQKCPDVSAMLPTDVPLAFLGETLDGEGGFMPCAPAADNFLSYYNNAGAPALAVTVLGANHMSFIDDVDSCGITCGFCQMPTLENDVVNDLSRAYVVAFYGRWLKDIAGYDAYLTGAEAQARYVDTGLVTIASK